MPNLPRQISDPYRELSVARAASDAEIKAAHRKLAKRFHPDATGGDAERFVAVQEAYQLLSDPLRRREWDARHAPGPVRADEPRRPRPRAADGRWTREDGAAASGRPRGAKGRRGARHADAGTQNAGAGRRRAGEAPGSSRDEPGGRSSEQGSAQAAWSGPDRPAGSRSYRWSAENVPWWEDFRPRDATAAGTHTGRSRPAKGATAEEPGPGPTAHAPRRPTQSTAASGAPSSTEPPGPSGQAGPDTPSGGHAPPADFDVYSRSSGAAWSSAARQYFRKATEDLPSRGAFVYRGTQVVTGAKAREVAEDLLRTRPGVRAAPRQSVDPRDDPDAQQPHRPRSARGTPARGAYPSPRTSGAVPPPEGTERGAQATSADGIRRGAGLVGAAAVGGAAALAVSLPVVALAGVMLEPPLQPAFALLLLLLAAVTGALAATIWVRVRPGI